MKTCIFSRSRKEVDQKKKADLYYKSTFFQFGVNRFCKLGFFFSGSRKKSEFVEPLFHTFLEKQLQIKWLHVYVFCAKI